jgi:hypothetical protein
MHIKTLLVVSGLKKKGFPLVRNVLQSFPDVLALYSCVAIVSQSDKSGTYRIFVNIERCHDPDSNSELHCRMVEWLVNDERWLPNLRFTSFM